MEYQRPDINYTQYFGEVLNYTSSNELGMMCDMLDDHSWEFKEALKITVNVGRLYDILEREYSIENCIEIIEVCFHVRNFNIAYMDYPESLTNEEYNSYIEELIMFMHNTIKITVEDLKQYSNILNIILQFNRATASISLNPLYWLNNHTVMVMQC